MQLHLQPHVVCLPRPPNGTAAASSDRVPATSPNMNSLVQQGVTVTNPSSQIPCRYDAIVVGLGAHGSACLYHLARWGSKVGWFRAILQNLFLAVSEWQAAAAWSHLWQITRAAAQGFQWQCLALCTIVTACDMGTAGVHLPCVVLLHMICSSPAVAN